MTEIIEVASTNGHGPATPLYPEGVATIPQAIAIAEDAVESAMTAIDTAHDASSAAVQAADVAERALDEADRALRFLETRRLVNLQRERRRHRQGRARKTSVA
jgi:hypothetical protein